MVNLPSNAVLSSPFSQTETELVLNCKMPDSALLVFPSQPLKDPCSSQLLKGWLEKVLNVFGEGIYYESYGQIRLTPEKPQVVPPGPP